MASLVADYGVSSGESSEDSEPENNDEKLEQTSNERLPPPLFSDKIKNSVFVNPFLEAENAKFAVLEKHVKMVPQSNGREHRKTCWMFKKGNCRFGKKCRFIHQEDVVGAGAADVKEVNYTQNQNDDSKDRQVDDEDDEPQKKKKRPGLTQGLVPGKRVMAMYRKQKEYSN